MSSFFLKLFGEKRFVYSVKVFPAGIKSINPIEKYPHIIESYACTRKTFVLMFLLEYVPHQKNQNSTCKATQWVPISEYSSIFVIYAPSFIFGRLSLE